MPSHFVLCVNATKWRRGEEHFQYTKKRGSAHGILKTVPMTNLCFMKVSPCWLNLAVILLPWKSNASSPLRQGMTYHGKRHSSSSSGITSQCCMNASHFCVHKSRNKQRLRDGPSGDLTNDPPCTCWHISLGCIAHTGKPTNGMQASILSWKTKGKE